MVENKVLVRFHLRGWLKPSAFVSDNSICPHFCECITAQPLQIHCRHRRFMSHPSNR